jgi:GH24 family phage-related lysozyme (muramidase)
MPLNWLQRLASRKGNRARACSTRPSPRAKSIGYGRRSIVESLEPRNVLSVTLSLQPHNIANSFAGVGFAENVVGEFSATVNGVADKNKGDFQAQIDWGDGGESTGDIVLKGDGSNVPFQIKGSHIYQANGDYTITVTLDGPQGSTKTMVTAVESVLNMPSGGAGTAPSKATTSSDPEEFSLVLTTEDTIDAYAGVGFDENALADLNGFLNGPQDKNLSDYQAYVNWGDSNTWDKADIAPHNDDATAAVQVKGSHVYAQPGLFRVVVYAVGPDGTSLSLDTVSVDVTAMPSGLGGSVPGSPVGSSPSIVNVVLYDQSSINAKVSTPFTTDVAALDGYVQGDQDRKAGDYHAQINWGDSTTWDQGDVVYQGDAFQVPFEITGSHTYTDPGTYPVVVYVNGVDGTSLAEYTTNVIVHKPPTPYLTGSITQTVIQGQPLSGQVLATFDSGSGETPPNQLSGTVDWGDGSPDENAPIKLDSGTKYEVDAPPEGHDYPTPGTYNVTVTVKDNQGDQSQAKGTITVDSNTADLTASVNADKIVPAKATDLNLNFLFGTEKVNVPVVVTNIGGAVAKGAATVSLYLSTTSDLSGTKFLLGSKSVTLNLASQASQTVNFSDAVPTSLKAGQQYYFVAKVSSTQIKEFTTANNTGHTSRTFEFVGTPKSNPSVFSGSTFFNFVRDTINGKAVTPANVNVSDAFSFIRFFEGDLPYAYLDSKNIPTIGVGINLNTVSGQLKTDLLKDVRSYYLTVYGKTLSSHDATVMSMLRTQAANHAKKQVITANQDQALFQETEEKYAGIAQNALPTVWSSLNAPQQVAMISVAFNLGSFHDFPTMVAAMNASDFLQAGFQLVDAKRTTQAPGLKTRTEAEFENLFAGNPALLGKIAS